MMEGVMNNFIIACNPIPELLAGRKPLSAGNIPQIPAARRTPKYRCLQIRAPRLLMLLRFPAIITSESLLSFTSLVGTNTIASQSIATARRIISFNSANISGKTAPRLNFCKALIVSILILYFSDNPFTCSGE